MTQRDVAAWLPGLIGPTTELVTNEGTGDLNDVATTDGNLPKSGVRFTGAAPVVTGFASGTPGRRISVHAVGGDVTLNHQDTDSAAVNRIITSTGSAVTVPEDAVQDLVYDSATKRWRLVGSSAGGGGGLSAPVDVTDIEAGPANGYVLGRVSGANAWALPGAARKAVATTGTIADLSLLDGSSNPVGTIGMTGGTATINSFAGGWDGRLLFVTNEHASLDVTLDHQTGGTAANRIVTVDAASLVLGPSETALLRYDATEARWRVMFAWTSGGASVPATGVVLSNGSALTSSTYLSHERGGLEDDVSAFAGLVKINGGATTSVALDSAVQTFLGTPSSANLRGALTDEVGAGPAVFAESPTIDDVTFTGGVTTSLTNNGTENGYIATYQGVNLRILEYVNELQSTTATTFALASWPVVDGTTTRVEFTVVMKATGTTAKAASYKGSVTYQRNSAGTPTICGAAEYDTAQETTAGDGVAFNLAGNNLQVDATSADADDRNWTIYLKIYECLDDGAAAAFDPESGVTSVTLLRWLDATNLTQGGGVVTAIDDASANDVDPTITGGQEPVYAATDANYANRPTWSCTTGSTKVIRFGTSHGLTSGAFTVVIVGACSSAGSNFAMGGHSGNTWIAGGGGSGDKWQMSSDAAAHTVVSTVTSITPAVAIFVFNGASSKMYVNAATPSTGNAGTLEDLTSINLMVGNYSTPSSSNGQNAAATHFLIYSGAINQTDAEYLLNGFGAESGITIGP